MGLLVEVCLEALHMGRCWRMLETQRSHGLVRAYFFLACQKKNLCEACLTQMVVASGFPPFCHMDPMERKDGIQMIQMKTSEETEAEMRVPVGIECLG